MAKRSAAAGSAAALCSGPTIAGIVGFGKAGIVGGSTAAGMMSALGGAATPAGGIVATLQTIGATSTVFVGAAPVIITGVAGAGIGYGAYKGYRALYPTEDK